MPILVNSQTKHTTYDQQKQQILCFFLMIILNANENNETTLHDT